MLIIRYTFTENASHAAKSEDRLEVVLAVPTYWSAKSRQRYCDAVNQSGFEVLQVLTEPSAALLAYDVGVDERDTATALVVRLGGLSSDISLLQVANGLYSLLDSTHLPHLGGNLLTEALCDYVAQEFCNKWKLDPRESRRTMVKLRQHAETCKHVLSTMPTAQVFIESLMDGIDWNQNVTRARFENVVNAKIPLFVRPIEEFVKKHSSVSVDKVSMRILVAHRNVEILRVFKPTHFFADRFQWWHHENPEAAAGHFGTIPKCTSSK